MFKKRGQGEQFNWIFIIIAGAVLLAFFATFTVKYIDLKKYEATVEMGRKFGQSMSIIQNMPITAKESGLSVDDRGNEEDGAFKLGLTSSFEYICNENNATKVYFNNDYRYSTDLRDILVFAPENMIINALDLWVLPWYYPFFVSNFVFLSDPKAEYYLGYLGTAGKDKDFVTGLRVPNNLNTIKDTKDKLISKAQKSSATIGRFVFFSTTKGALKCNLIPLALKKKFNKADVKLVTFEGTTNSYGTVEFCKEDGTSAGNVKFYGLPLMWGAVFSDSAETYSCVMNTAIKKLKNVGDIYMTKSSLLGKTESTGCSTFYGGFRSAISGFTGKNFETAGYKTKDQIDKANEDLMGKGCAYVY